MYNTIFSINFVDFIEPKTLQGIIKTFSSDDLFKDEF